MIALLLTAVAVVANTINSIGGFASIVTEVRFWPPGERDWRYWLTWLHWYPATAAFILVGVLDWGSLDIVPFGGRIAGVVGVLVGLGITFAAIFELGVSETEGLEGKLHTDGLYRYTRNPQYVGDILSAIGWAAVTDSRFVMIVGATFVLYYLLLPFAEEPWLHEQYGPAYERYCREVPRFISLQSVYVALAGRE